MLFKPSLKLPFIALTVASFSTLAHAEAWVPTATKATHTIATSSMPIRHLAAMPVGSIVHIVVALKLRNKPSLDTLTKNIITGHTKTVLSRAKFMQHYAPTQEQVQAVVAHLSHHGFTNITVSDNNLLIRANGAAAAVKSAFNSQLDTYDVNGRIAYANINDAFVPQSLGNTVLAVLGLQTVHMAHTTAKKYSGKKLGIAGHNPTDFPTIYNADGLPKATSATIGIITQGDMTQTLKDLQIFASNSNYPAPNVRTIVVNGASSDTSGMSEWNMDSQDSLAAAGGAIQQMLLYTANSLSDSDLTDTYNQAVSDNLATAINVSLGECETYPAQSGASQANDQIFETAAVQGQMFSVSSGDSGSDECGDGGTAQSYPAVSPYVVALGGTTLAATGTTNNIWAAETVWTDSGGGPSSTEAAPFWQTNANILSSSSSMQRGVPDISLDADPSSGALVLINGALEQWGGTSLSAPLFAGFWARVQSQHQSQKGTRLPFPSALIYSNAANNPAMFHDVTSGSNGAFDAKSGWDYTTGYGSLDVTKFAAIMNGNNDTPPPPNTVVLSNNTPVTGLNLPFDGTQLYSIDVPAGAKTLTFQTSGGSGDCDIFVKFGAPASMYDITSERWSDAANTNTELVSIPNPQAGTYYLLLSAASQFSGVTLVANYQ